MRPITIVANLKVPNIEDSKDFYRDFLGLGSEEFNLGWVARFTSPDSGACVQLVTRDETSPSDSVVSVMTDDVDAAYAEALSRGFDIVRPLTTESWGVRRFLVRAPDGNVVNIVHHHS
ncbi:MAG: VOC family protein [Rhodococcus sp. (in: high G+C Gram-positive bacteria)]